MAIIYFLIIILDIIILLMCGVKFILILYNFLFGKLISYIQIIN